MMLKNARGVESTGGRGRGTKGSSPGGRSREKGRTYHVTIDDKDDEDGDTYVGSKRRRKGSQQ